LRLHQFVGHGVLVERMYLYNLQVSEINCEQDLSSYNVEQAMGYTGDNILIVLVREGNTNIQEAAERIGIIFKQVMARFLKDKSRLSSWGAAIDRDVAVSI
jgi:hypothetical protein